MWAFRRFVIRPVLLPSLVLAALPAVAQMPPGHVIVLGASMVEGGSGTRPLRFLIQRPPGLPGPASLALTYATRDAGAVAGSDYTAVSGTVTLTAAAPIATVDVPVLGDTLAEPTERFELVVAVAGSALGVVGSGAIRDDDGGQPPPPPDVPVGVSPLDATVREPASGETEGSLALLRFGPVDAPLIVGFAVSGGLATPGKDYEGPTSGQVTFAIGQRIARLAFAIRADAAAEGVETIRVAFTVPPGVRLLRADATLRILDRAPGGPPTSGVGVIACRPLLHETAGAARFVLRRTGDTTAPLALDYASEDVGAPGGATAGVDYTATSGRIAWPAGSDAPQLVEVPLLPDDAIEPPERFALALAGAPTGVLLAPARAFALILDARDDVFTDEFASLCENPQMTE